MKPRRLMTETLEERQLLAVGVLEGASAAVVDTANIIDVASNVSIDSIKQAIAEASATREDDVIRINAASLQFLSASDEITIDVDSSSYGSITLVAVDGDVTIDANSLSRAFSIKNGDVTLQGINVINGSADYGGAIANSGDLTLVDVTLSDNVATVSGGAVANSGTLAIQDSIISGNSAADSGAAIFEGDFFWPTSELPEWSTIPEQVGSKGTTISVDLSDYVNSGDWDYSFTVVDSSSVILASDPTLTNGVLSFTFIGDDDFYAEDDYSALQVTVTASDGTNSASTSFAVSLAEQTSVTLAAVLSNMTIDDAMDEYVQGSKRRPIGYAADEIPSPSIVDVSQETTVQIWLQDFDWTNYADKTWDAGEFDIMGVQYRVHLENATVDEDALLAASDLSRSSYVVKKLDNGDYEFIIAYTSGANFGYEEALLLDVLPISVTDSSQPVSATIYQLSTDFTFPCYTRLYTTPTERDATRSHINVDPSQTLFVSTISNSSEPLSSVAGQPFDTNVPTSSAVLEASNANLATTKSLVVSNSLIVDNNASGKGAIYVSNDGSASFYNVTIADNSASDAAVFYAGSDSDAVTIANTIVVNESLEPVYGAATITGSLVNISNANGGTLYVDGPLFADAANGDYSLVYRSAAMNIGENDKALDVSGVALTTDLAGSTRAVGSVDAGAYEYQGSVPVAPTTISITDYEESNKKPVLSWSASTSEDVDSYLIYLIDGETSEIVASVDGSVVSYADLANDVQLESNKIYTFGVAASNAFGVSSIVSVTLNTALSPSAPTNVALGDYSDGSVTINWTASENATSYKVESLDSTGAWTSVGSTTKSTYVVDGLNDFSTYTFRVTAVNSVGSASSDSVVLSTIVSPDAPTGLKWSNAYTGDGNMTLVWNAVDNARGYTVYQKVDGQWSAIGTVSKPTYSFSGLTDNTTYEFSVAAYAKDSENNILYSDSAEISLTTAIAPSAPTNVRWTTEYDGSGSAGLTWDAVDDAYAYSIAQLVDGEWQEIKRTVSTTYTVSGLANNSEYTFGVAAYTTSGSKRFYSDYTSVDLNTVVAPDAPTSVAFDEYAGGTSANLTWNAVNEATGYLVEALNSSNVWESVATVTTTSYSATVEENSSYSYRVSAFTTVGDETRYSATVTAELDTLVAPATPADAAFGSLDSSANSISVSWSAVDHADGYIVESFDATNNTWKVVEREDATATSFLVADIAADSTYTFRVSAYNEAGVSEPTVVSYSTSGEPDAPTNLTAKYFQGSRSANLSWDFMTDADGYRVYVLAKDGYTWNKVANLSSISHVYTVQNLETNTDYVFGVSAYNEFGESDYSIVLVSTLTTPAAPTDAAFEMVVGSNSAATMSWTAVEGADGYLIEQQINGEWTEVSTLAADATSWTVSGLDEGASYTYRISAFNDAGSSDAVEVVLTIDATVAPLAPTDFQIVSYSEETHRATMSWTDNATNETGYEVQYSYNGTDWISSATLSADSTTRVASGLTPGSTYYFRVAAFNSVGYSEWAQISYDVPAEIPAAPTDVVFGEYDAEAKTVVVSWTDNSDDEIGFRIQYSLDQTEWYTSANTDADVVSYEATGIVPGRTYYYRVAAVGLYGVSDWAEGSFTVDASNPDKPAAPSGIVFSDSEITTSGVNVTMSWTDNSDNEERFVVQFSYDNENWYGAGTTDANVSTRVATGLVSGRTYYFRVAAYNEAGYSDWTTATYVAPSSDVNAPSEIVFGEYSNGQLPMSWTDNSDDEDGFVVQFSYDGVNWHRGGTTAANVTSRVATSMTPGRLYYFRVAAYNADGYSDWVVGQYTTPSGAPAATGELSFSNYSAEKRTVEMSWVDNSGDETGFNVEYSVDGGNTWLTSGNTSADINYRTATGLRVGVTYQFRVRSFNAYGASGWTVGSFTVPTSENAPAAPTDFVFGEYNDDAKTLAMSWTDNATNESGYKVQYSVDGGTTWYSAGTYGANVTSRVATSVSSGRSYTFRVAAYNADGASAWLTSEAYEVSASSNIPASPSNVTFSDYDSAAQTVVMSWTDNSTNEKGFKVEYSVDGGSTWNASAYLSSDVSSYVVSGLVAGQNYSFRVSAYNNYGYSDSTIGSFSVVATEEVAAPTDLAFAYSSTKRRITVAWNGDAEGYNVQYQPEASSEWYTLQASGKSAILSGVTYGSAYRFRVQAVADDGSLSEWIVDSFDTKTGLPIASNAIVDSSARLVEEAFADFFDDLL